MQQRGKSRLVSVLKIIDHVSEVVGKLGSWLVIALLVVTVHEIFRRYVFNAPSQVTYVLSTFLYSGHFLLAGAWVLARREHIRIDVVYERFPPRVRAALDTVLYVGFFFLFLSLITWEGFWAARESWVRWEHSFVTQWHPPLYPIKTVVPIAGVLMLLQGLANLVRDAAYAIKGVRL